VPLSEKEYQKSRAKVGQKLKNIGIA